MYGSQEPSADVNQRWLEHLRRKNRTTRSFCCTKCDERPVFTTSDSLFDHALLKHASEIPSESEAKERHVWRAQYDRDALAKLPLKDIHPHRENSSFQGKKRPLPQRSLSGLPISELSIGTTHSDVVNDASSADHDLHEKRRATGNGISTGFGSPRRDNSSSPTPRRSKVRPTSAPYGTVSCTDSSEKRITNNQIWSDVDRPLSRCSALKDTSKTASIDAAEARARHFSHDLPRTSSKNSNSDQIDIILQPETRPISQEQLVAEVKGIYAGLVMVEAKCIEVDNKQAKLAQADPTAQPKLNNDQWQALIALHRTLLHEHHDFFLASQHPSASPALRRLAAKYAMPARMWRHGIHSFLELLRHRLPNSKDHMLSFIYLAYSMMVLLYETVPAFKDTWIECLGELGRYRMAIEDDDVKDHCYSRACDRGSMTGRPFRPARPHTLQQLCYHSRMSCMMRPFISARESIQTLFEPVINSRSVGLQYRSPLDASFVKAHGLLFTNSDTGKFDSIVTEFLGLLENQIGRATRKFLEQSYDIAVANAVAILGFVPRKTLLMKSPNQLDPHHLHEQCCLKCNLNVVCGDSKDNIPTPYLNVQVPPTCITSYETSYERLKCTNKPFQIIWDGWERAVTVASKITRNLCSNRVKVGFSLWLIRIPHASASYTERLENADVVADPVFAEFPLYLATMGISLAIVRWGPMLGDGLTVLPAFIDMGLCYAATDPAFSTAKIIATGTIGVAMNEAMIRPRLKHLKRTTEATRLAIGMMAMSSAYCLYRLDPTLTKDYPNRMTAMAVWAVPAGLGWTHVWFCFEALGFAKKLDDGHFDDLVSSFFGYFLNIARYVIETAINLLLPRLVESFIDKYLLVRRLPVQIDVQPRQSPDFESEIGDFSPREERFDESFDLDGDEPGFPDGWPPFPQH